MQTKIAQIIAVLMAASGIASSAPLPSPDIGNEEMSLQPRDEGAQQAHQLGWPTGVNPYDYRSYVPQGIQGLVNGFAGQYSPFYRPVDNYYHVNPRNLVYGASGLGIIA